MQVPRSVRRTILFAVLMLFVPAGAAVAQTSWAVAQRPDASLNKFLDKLMPHAAKVPGAAEAGAIILYKQHFLKSQEKNYEICTNMVFLVKDPSRVGEDLTMPYLDGQGKYPERNAFIRRGDKILRYDEEKSEVVLGVDDIHRNRIIFDLPPLQKGDLVGWSIVESHEGLVQPWMAPAADRYPVVYCSVRILNDGSSSFVMASHGFPDAKASTKTEGLVNDRPEQWKAHAGDLAAIENLPATAPFDAETPVFAIALTERHSDNPKGYRGWVPMASWINVAAMLSGVREAILDDTGSLDIQASAITTGLADDAAKEKAVYEYVRDKIQLLDGDEYDRSEFRTIKEVMSAKAATPFEKSALMLALLDAAGVPAEIGAVHPASWGSLDTASKTLIDFNSWVVRCGGEEPRFYAPYVEGLPAGALPADWGKAEILSPTPGLLEKVRAYQKKVGTEEFAKAGKIDPARLLSEAEAHAKEKGWYRIETLSTP